MIVGTSKINEKGQITIPKEIRDKLGTRKGDRLIFDLEGDIIHIRKSGTNNISEILENQKAWDMDSIQFQKKLRGEWE